MLGDAMHTQDQTAQQILYEQGGDYLLTVKRNQSTIHDTLGSLFEKQAFPPAPTKESHSMKREHNRGRLEIRMLDCIEVCPKQAGFPGARLAARLEPRVKRKGKWSREVVYLLSSFTLDQLEARRMVSLKRGYWVVESRLHHCLDITLREAQSRVRTPTAARALGTI